MSSKMSSRIAIVMFGIFLFAAGAWLGRLLNRRQSYRRQS
jgi:hypothetical protein